MALEQLRSVLSDDVPEVKKMIRKNEAIIPGIYRRQNRLDHLLIVLLLINPYGLKTDLSCRKISNGKLLIMVQTQQI